MRRTNVPPVAAPRRWRWRVRMLALFSVGVASLVLAELLLRLAAPLDPRQNGSWYQAHPVYHFRHRAWLDETFVWGQPYRVRTNARGLREDENIPYAAGEEWRVVLLGDSFTFGNGVENEETFARVAEADLRRTLPASNVRVINLGVSAHGPSLESLYFREEGARYEPRAVVVGVFCGNDVADDARDRAFALVDGKLVEQPFHISVAKRLTDGAAYQWVIRRSQLVVRLRQAYAWLDDHVWHAAQRRAQLDAMNDPEALARGWPLSRAVWNQLAEQIRQAGATPVFLLIPTSEQVDQQAGREVAHDSHPAAEPTRQRLLNWAKTEGLHVVDLAPRLARESRQSGDLYLEGDFHFNERGHRLTGQMLAEALLPLAAEIAPATTP